MRAPPGCRDCRSPAASGSPCCCSTWAVALVGFLVNGIFLSVLYYPNFWLLLGFTVAAKQVARTLDADGSPTD